MIQRNRPSWLDRLLEYLGVALIAATVLVIVVALVLGLVQVARASGGLVAHIASHTRLSVNWDWFHDLYSTQQAVGRQPTAEKIAAIGAFFTAIFTLLLCWVTRAIGRASQRQAAGDAPLLRVSVSVDPVSTEMKTAQLTVPLDDDSQGRPIPEQLATEPVADSSERFIRIQVENVQTKPFAVARDIVVSVLIMLRGETEFVRGDDGPLLEERRFELELLPPEAFVTRPLFKIGPNTAGEVSVTDVAYRDLRGRRRRQAAYGQMNVSISADGTIKGTDGYSRPERWEMP